MGEPNLGTGGRPMATLGPAPARIAIEAGWELSCPWHGRITFDRCRDCPFLQGTLEGPEIAVLCGFGHGAPIHRGGGVPAVAVRREPSR
jgi:hypothetical protein